MKENKQHSNFINNIIDSEYNKDNSIINSKRKLNYKDTNNVMENIIKQKNKVSFNLEPLYSKSKINDKIKNNYSHKEKGKFIFTNNFSPTINIQTPVIHIKDQNIKLNNEKSKTKNKDGKMLETKNDNKKAHFKKQNNKMFLKGNDKNKYNKKIEKKVLYNIETNEEKRKDNNKSEINQEIIKLSKNDEDIQEMDFEKAFLFDKRSFIRMYWAFLVDTQIILGTFCTENYLNLFVIKLSFFIYTFQISFFLNAFFYTDEYISDAYHNDGILDFVSGLPKSIYSFVATLITTNLLKMLSNSKNELMKVIREKRGDKNYSYLIEIKLRKLRKKLFAYFIFVFILGLLFLYYVSTFCAVYRHSQLYWFIGCLESFGIDSLVAIIICILLALLRYISIKSGIKCLYILANIIGTFL